jgi:hypothetical protein
LGKQSRQKLLVLRHLSRRPKQQPQKCLQQLVHQKQGQVQRHLPLQVVKGLVVELVEVGEE